MRPDAPRSGAKILARKLAVAQRQRQKEEVTSAFRASQRRGLRLESR